MCRPRTTSFALLALVLLVAVLPACTNQARTPPSAGADGPVDQGPAQPLEKGNIQTGDAAVGREVFRFETFGNEGFWTDAVRLPEGLVKAGVTPMMALELGVLIDADALDEGTLRTLKQQLQADSSGTSSELLNDPKALVMLVNANAVIGMPIKDSNGDGRLDVASGDKVGASCALCHTITDKSVFAIPNGGSIGSRIDGPANHDLQMGKILASAANSRALYPVLQLSLHAHGGKTLGRAPVGLTETSTEADVDAYLSNPEFYPVGMFDDSFDGNGDPMHNMPLFRQDLAGPYGSEGTFAVLDNFSNLIYTALFDQTMLTTPGGRALLRKLAGPAGAEIADDYVKILEETNVKGYPYVNAAPHPEPGSLAAPLGVRVDNSKLLALNAYQVSMPAPAGAEVDVTLAARGRHVFRTAGCTECHNVQQNLRVPSFVVPMETIYPGDDPVVLAQRKGPLNPILNTPPTAIEGTPLSVFDDKMAVINASIRGGIRGTAMPLLLDLARKPVFLHDNSVASLELLFDASRGPTAPHPFYVQEEQRAAVIEFLHGLDTDEEAGNR